MKKIIGISGLAGDGKDTVCNILGAFFTAKGLSFERVSLADSLKEECSKAMKAMFGIDPLDCSREEKEIIRSYLVFYAKVKRIQSNGKHWTSIADKIIKADKVHYISNKIYCVPDIRHAFYAEDEAQWVKKNGGILIHVKKFKIKSTFPYNIEYSIPVNQDEAFNTPIVEKYADHILELNDCSPQSPCNDSNYVNAVHEVGKRILDSINGTKSHSASQKKPEIQ